MTEELVRAAIHREPSLTEYGRTLARVGLRAQRLETCLRMVEWGGPDTQGLGPCPACSRFPSQGHAEDCFLDAALQPHDAITHVEDTVRLVRELLRNGSIQTYIDGIQANLNDLHTAVDYALKTLDRL